MREVIEIPVDEVKPCRDDVLRTQGIPAGKEPIEHVETLFRNAIQLFLRFSRPVGVIVEISIPEFEIVYRGEGLNEEETPLNEIFRKADDLALFVLTMGDEVSRKIDELFQSNDFALGSMLDAVASCGADEAADIVTNHFSNLLSSKGRISPLIGILRYSPGYCGWHVSGQKKLFEILHPEDIGVMLLDSFIMKPLKSVSGVLVAGRRDIHDFRDSYPFCKQCKTHSCRDRIRALFEPMSKNTKGVV